MQIVDGEMILSPSDLIGFVACAHLVDLELAVARGEQRRPNGQNPLLEVLARRGDEHERAHLERLRAEGLDVVELPFPEPTLAALHAAELETRAAMARGASVIYQASFFDGRCRGHADFLVRVDAASPELGSWSYEAVDTKLARRVKAEAIVQLCSYSEHIARLQGSWPRQLHVLGGDHVQHSYRVADYAAYARGVRRHLVAELEAPRPEHYPERVGHCSICRWSDECADRRRSDDHLVLVAGMRNDQAVRLRASGIPTRAALASNTSAVAGFGDATLQKLRAQAALQVHAAGRVPPEFELLEPVRAADGTVEWGGRGLAGLPEPSPGDLFFDMEGDQFALDGGLEYLFGVVEHGPERSPRFHTFWAHDRDEERAALESFVDFVESRRREHPDLHIYHYAPYEPNALKRLMGEHATREREIDSWLRGKLFVDLYAVVKQAVRLSTESYGLKAVESLYLPARDGAVVDAGGSVVAYEEYLASRDPARLEEIAVYNEADSASLVGLREWLEARRVEAAARCGPVPRRGAESDGTPSEQLDAREADVERLVARLLDGHAGDPARVLLASLLSWHRREAKPEWWAYYERRDSAEQSDFVDDRECIGGLELQGIVGTEGRSTVYRYGYEPQDHKIGPGDKPHDPATGKLAGEVTAVDDLARTIDLRRGAKVDARQHPRALMPSTPVPTDTLEDALRELGAWVADHGLDGPGPWRAARDLLARRPPRLRGLPRGEPLAHAGEHGLEAARRLLERLDQSSLAVQGPPGSGKTFTAAHLVVDLVKAGKRVGITAHSHAVIGNLLTAVTEVGGDLGILQKCKEDEWCGIDVVARTDDNKEVEAALAAGGPSVVGGTAWLWTRGDAGIRRRARGRRGGTEVPGRRACDERRRGEPGAVGRSAAALSAIEGRAPRRCRGLRARPPAG